MDEASDDRHERHERVHDLNHPKQLRPHKTDVLIVGPALEEELLRPVLVRIEEPPDSQQSFPGDVFGDPKVDDGEHSHHLIKYQAIG